MSEPKYFQFPLFMLRELLDKPKQTLYKIAEYGCWNYANKLTLTPEQIADRVIYAFYRNKLDSRLHKMIQGFINDGSITELNDFDIFQFGSYDPFDNRPEFLNLFNENSEFYELADDYARKAYTYYKLNITGEPNYTWCNFLEIPDREPMPSVYVRALIDTANSKPTELELIIFAAAIALNSICGKGSYKRTNKLFMLSRMFGYSTPAEVPAEPPQLFKKYLQRYHFERLILHLEQRKIAVYYSTLGMNGFYIGNPAKNINRQTLADAWQRVASKEHQRLRRECKQATTTP